MCITKPDDNNPKNSLLSNNHKSPLIYRHCIGIGHQETSSPESFKAITQLDWIVCPLSTCVGRSVCMVSLIIFVCTSNTCRSPMAEQFAVQWLIQNNLTTEYQIISRALTEKYEPQNSPASSHSIQILADEFALDLNFHRSSMLSAKEVDDAQIIIGVTTAHVEKILRTFPSSIGKVFSFDSDISDPWHASLAEYRVCAQTMKPLVYQILDRILM